MKTKMKRVIMRLSENLKLIYQIVDKRALLKFLIKIILTEFIRRLFN